MSWLYSRALVAAYSADTCLDGAASAPSSAIHTPKPSCSQGKTTGRSRHSLSGMTSAPSTDGHGEALLTWFLAGFHAKTLALQAKERESLASVAGYGDTWPGSLARWSRDTSSWRTPQLLLAEGWGSSSVTWPRWGLMRRGACWARTPAALPTSGSGCGLLLPTLTVCGNYNRKGASKTSGDGLATAVKRLPTLRATDATRGDCPSERARHQPSLVVCAGGPLNPTWLEWFMGWPIGWTELGALETDRFRQWCASHGKC